MSTCRELNRIKECLAALPARRTRRLPSALHLKIGQYGRLRLAEGASRNSVADELGIGYGTLVGALKEPPEATETWVPVRVKAESSSSGGSSIRVHGPDGLVIEGLDIARVAELLRGLS